MAAAARSCGIVGAPRFAQAVMRDPATAQALLRAIDAVETAADPRARDEAVAAAFGLLALRRGEACAAGAVDMGFADQAHLNRAFKAIVGATPGACRAAWTRLGPAAA